MSIQGKITSLYTDKTMSEALLPRTNTKAITDDKGVNLNAILDQVAYVDTENSEAAIAPLNADTLAGFPADSYASKTYVSNKIAEAQLGGGSGEGNIDLSGYATKDDLNALDAEDIDALPITGGEVTGDLTVHRVNVKPRDDGYMPAIRFTDNESTVKGAVSSTSANRMLLQNNCVDTTYSEYFYTPEPDTERTENGNYTMLTTKHTVTLEQGGTGAAQSLVEAPKNAIIKKIGDGKNQLYYQATDNGAFYATEKDGAPQFGTLPVAQGGTGATTAADALSNLGITATAAELNKMDGITATTAELNYVDGVTSNIQTQLNGKQATITGGVSSVVSSNFNANRALISNGDGKAASSAVTSTELSYLDGVTSNIQTQINNANLGKLVRLWTNSKPTSSFASQTISLTLSGYDYVLVCATWDINNPHRTLPCHIAQVGGSYDGGYLGGRNPSSGTFVGRSMDVTTSGVTFAGGYSGTSSDNKVCIPFAIFGINI